MDTIGNRLIVALGSHLFHIFDVCKMNTSEQTRESSLKFLTRALSCMSDSQGVHSASMRLYKPFTFLFFQDTPWPPLRAASPSSILTLRQLFKKKVRVQMSRSDDRRCKPCMACKCARLPPDLQYLRLWQIRCYSLIWDHKVKKRLCQYPCYTVPIATLAFLADGTHLAIGASCTGDVGKEGARTTK